MTTKLKVLGWITLTEAALDYLREHHADMAIWEGHSTAYVFNIRGDGKLNAGTLDISTGRTVPLSLWMGFPAELAGDIHYD